MLDKYSQYEEIENRIEDSYRTLYASESLQDILVFRSGPHAVDYVGGMDFADNARALFEYALDISLNKRYELIWIVKDPKNFGAYSGYENVKFLAFEDARAEGTAACDEYYRVMCLAKYLFFTDSYGFARNCRQDQARVQLWHGCGFKRRLGTKSCADKYEYMTVTGPEYVMRHAIEFGLHENQLLSTGIPKTDWLFDTNPYIFEKLGIPSASKYILWMPTYRFSEAKFEKHVDGSLREETGLPLIASFDLLKEIDTMLVNENMVLVIKLHPFQDKTVLHINGLSNIVLLDNAILQKHDIQINRVLAHADALISDYSSTAIDYLILNRPMAFLLEDEAEYRDKRGFIFDDIESALPGVIIRAFNGLVSFIEDIAYEIDSSREKRELLRSKYHANYDGMSSKRVLETLGII